MPKPKTTWVCEFCNRKRFMRKSRTLEHERQCFKNPNRTPYLGELTFISQLGSIKNFGFDNSINDVWLEWVEHKELPPWHPGEAGMIYNGAEWIKVLGYEQIPAKPGHGCAGGAPDDEVWPELNGIPLPENKSRDRLETLS